MSERPETDHELIAAYVGGDAAAFDRLYARYRLPLYGYLNRLVHGDAATVDDLFQQTWSRILDALPRYRDEQRFLSWSFRIAHNAAMDHYRGAAKGVVELSDEVAAVVPDEQMRTAWEQLAGDELREALAEGISRLAAEQREVVLLRQQGLSFQEIADVQRSPLNTVLGRMYYAVRHLRRHLAAWC